MRAFLFDIESGRVNLSVVDFYSNQVPQIIFFSESSFPHQSRLGGKNFIDAGLSSIRSLKEKLDNKHITPAEHVSCFLGPHLVMSKIGSEKIIFKDNRILTENDLNNLVTNNDLDKLDTMDLAEKRFLDVRVNGYKTGKDLIGLKAKELSVTTFTSFAAKSFLFSLKNELIKLFPGTSVDTHSSTLPILRVLNQLFADRYDNFIFLNITDDITEIGIIRDASVRKLVSFPVGKGSFVYGHDGSTDIELIRSVVKSYGRGHLRENSIWRNRILERYKIWKDAVLNILSNEYYLPEKVFIISDEESSEIYRRVLSEALNGHNIETITSGRLLDFSINKSGERYATQISIESIFLKELLVRN